jgi:predicted phage terminase large subunit-like protein|tara:strand:+ start:1103 stop:2758 length:1656 start_codon:yes stop_codon:yes gene_type:complete
MPIKGVMEKRLPKMTKEDVIEEMYLDIFLFAKIIFGDEKYPMHYHLRAETPYFHREINSKLQKMKAGKKLAIVAPRGHAKSTFVNLIYPLHRVLYGEEHFILLISESETQSKYNLESIGNEIEYNKKLKYFFGDRRGEVWGKEEKEIIGGMGEDGKPVTTCKVLVRGCGQKVRGLKYGAYRPTLTIIDDGEGEANTLTPGQRDKFRRWLNAAVIPGSNDAKMVFVGTIIDEESYLNRVAGPRSYNLDGTKKIKGWDTMFYQAILQDTEDGEFVSSGKEVLGDDGKPKVLWEDYKPFEWLEDERQRLISEGDAAYFYQEYQNIPMDDSFRVFKTDDILYWHGRYANEGGNSFIYLQENDERIKTPINTFIGVDPASSENVRADYTVIMVVGVDAKYNIYVLDYFRGQVRPMDGADKIFEMADIYNPRCINIEETGHVMLADYVLRKSKETGRFLNINPKKAIKTKFYRIKQLQPYFASHAMFLRESQTELRQELLAFTELGRHKKDTLDALRWATDDVWVPTGKLDDKGEWVESSEILGADWETGQIIYGEA